MSDFILPGLPGGPPYAPSSADLAASDPATRRRISREARAWGDALRSLRPIDFARYRIPNEEFLRAAPALAIALYRAIERRA